MFLILVTAMVLSSELVLSTNVTTSVRYIPKTVQNIVVDKTGNGDYLTIKEAIDNAIEGSTISVKTGEYPEIIEINKKIVLLGEDIESTLINPISRENKYAISIGAPEVTISGFSITNGAPGLYSSGIRVSADEVEINNCKFFDNPIGIIIWSSKNVINNCEFFRCIDEGIAILGSKYSSCGNNEIKNCLFYENCDGIELQYSSENVIENCEIYSNTHAGIDAIVSENNNNIISNCRIYDNDVFGIYFSSSSNNKVMGCYITNNYNDVEIRGSSINNEIEYSSEEISEVQEKNEMTNLINLLSKIKNYILPYIRLNF